MIGLKNLKIGTKLMYGFGVVLTLMFIISSVTLWKLRAVEGFVDEASMRAEDSVVLEKTVWMAHQLYAVLADAWINQDLDANRAEFEELRKQYSEDMVLIATIVDTEEERRQLAIASARAQKIIDIYPRWIELIKIDNTKSIQELDSAIDGWREEYREALQTIASDLAGEREESSAVLQNTVRNVFLVILVLTIVAIVAGIGMALLISRAVVAPIRQTTAMLKEIASGDGDLTARLDASSRDEIGDLARNFNQFIEKLQNIIAQISGRSETLSTSAMDLSSVSTQTAQSVRTLSERTSLIAAAAEETSANTDSVAGGMEQATNSLSSVAGATEEMSATVSEIAGNTEKARRISEQAMQQAQGVTSTMQALGTAAQEIDRVTETITEISSQTNLLALNATIEAARAGEAGKGFAVVAGEIKELARQTAQATEDIKRRISAIQASTGSAVTDINQINQVICEVGELVNSIAAAIEEQSVVTRDLAGNIAQVSAGVQDANERVGQTAEVSREMARDIAEVNTAATDIRSGGEQVQASAAELTSLAEQLKSLVGQFKVGAIAQSATQSGQLIVWEDSLSVGVPTMDDHHKELIRIINALHAALKEKRGLDVTRKLLRDLTGYVDFHFRAEEDFLAGIKYPELEDQKISHRKFEDKLASMQQRWNAGDTSVTSEMMRMLQDWLIAHIKVMDMKYGEMVRKSR